MNLKLNFSQSSYSIWILVLLWTNSSWIYFNFGYQILGSGHATFRTGFFFRLSFFLFFFFFLFSFFLVLFTFIIFLSFYTFIFTYLFYIFIYNKLIFVGFILVIFLSLLLSRLNSFPSPPGALTITVVEFITLVNYDILFRYDIRIVFFFYLLLDLVFTGQNLPGITYLYFMNIGFTSCRLR
ncbi:uncharacterized protein BX664DRAFT_64958 [Halteromyces radiatus]|uniref:uncharacterized protein n=1 Tax=Halteromyces radiatus TaxID=101107 RepID=UPI00221E535B|nr:uncharacterized protein BX664DRAFT_64958 [Halteromyces radiatus]KAI8096720.1 hypothetical protein BX664DRAFT_64958 [Halteromyces radiatus]